MSNCDDKHIVAPVKLLLKKNSISGLNKLLKKQAYMCDVQ